ncbi:MAG: hypothetical protein IJK12_01145 [Clostridia bacterium]|nr:hypothetical protein [Clostridia bacterium]
MKTTAESLLAYAERELVHKESIRAAVLNAAPQRAKIAWTKVLLPIAACLVLLCGTVLIIPSARAEVARWFRIESPEQYLTEDPENRVPNEQIESLIVPPVTDAPKTAQLTYVSDDAIWQQIAEDFRIDPGDTLYDGDELYIQVTLHGLSALPEIDATTGGSATQTKIPLERVGEFFEDGKVPEVYTSGQMSFCEDTMGYYFLEFPDGARISCGTVSSFWANPEYRVLLNEHQMKYGDDPLSDADREAISAQSIEWLKGRSLVGVVHCPMHGRLVTVSGDWNNPDGYTYAQVDSDSYLMEQADENGIVRATLLYRSAVDDDGTLIPKLEANLGTVRFDMKAVERLERKPLTAAVQSVTFGPQKVKLTDRDWTETDYDDSTPTVIDYDADLNGLTYTVEDAGYLDALGVHDVRVRMTLPEGWTEQMCRAFRINLHVDCEIDGERYTASSERNAGESHTLLLTLDFTSIPYDRIGSIRTLKIISALHYTEEIAVGNARFVLRDGERFVYPDTDEPISEHGGMITLEDGVLTLTAE